MYPNSWDVSAAGHVSAGEEPIVSGLREIQEEIGLQFKQTDLDFFKINKVNEKYKEIINNEFHYIYFVKFDGDISQLKLQAEEVQDVRFFSIEQIERELKEHTEKYVPHGDYWFEVLEEVKRRHFK